MELTTKTAKRLKHCREYMQDSSNPKNVRVSLQFEVDSIRDFKNELNEILDDKNSDEPIAEYYERMYIKLMTLKTEIENVENDKQKQG